MKERNSLIVDLFKVRDLPAEKMTAITKRYSSSNMNAEHLILLNVSTLISANFLPSPPTAHGMQKIRSILCLKLKAIIADHFYWRVAASDTK